MADMAALGAFLNVLFDRLGSLESVNLILGKKLEPKLIRRLKTTLSVVGAVLNDAEKKQFSEAGVNNWLNDLKDAVYDTDDLLDEIATKAATQKEEVSNLFSRLFNVQDREMVSKLEDIVERLDSVLKLKESLDLKEIAVENLSYKTPSTSLLPDGSDVYGRDKDKEAIIKLLLDDKSNGGQEVSVIPIVGMGGVGKTTLAQLVYNDDRLKNIFDLKAWVCVSEEFDILRVTKIIAQAVTKSTCEMNDLNLLHLDLQDRLKEKKFLIVLDDVWIENYVNWDLLKKPIQRGVRGSKILVTTRSKNVASVVQTVPTYNLNQLSNEDCWLVFADHACFSQGSSGNAATLEKIGKEIVKKCAGLPLAAQSLGGILRQKHDIRDWENLLKSDIWELSESESNILPALRVSYHYLPPPLKRCFVYCSLFPKDYEFEKDDVILLWMAEDLLPPPSKGKTLEEAGCEYFDYLVARSFLQCSIGSWAFVMHDLLHDLATFLGGEFYFRSEDPGVETKISIKTRHLSFTKFSGLLKRFEVLGTAKFLRTFLPMGYVNLRFNVDGTSACMLKLKHLRVLSFCRFGGLDALPDSIGELIHLRYLDLSQTSIMSLPESLGNLYNLQTLKLLFCIKLNVLPSGMQNLVNLHSLDIRGTPLKEMPQGMGKLTQLQHLSDYIVGKKHEENGIKELGGLSNLHGSLSISKLENVSNGSEALKAKMVDKKCISKLWLTWSSTADNCFDSQTEMDILCKLQPHQDLQLLEIDGYRGTRFPDWVGNSSYHNMTDITVSSCKNCWRLPSLGQLPSLKKLSISCLDALVTIDDGFYKNNDSSLLTPPFPFLESLTFEHMPCWEVWSPIEPDAFPKLKTLQIENCPKLRGDLPSHLPFLESLILENMPCWEVWSPIEPDAFPKLKILKIDNCPKLRGDLPSHLPALEELDIRRCTELASSLPRASAIHRLKIVESNKVALQDGFSSLETLDCKGLPHLTSLKSLRLDGLETLDCKGLLHLTSLKSLRLDGFSSLETLDCKGLLHLTSLQELAIQHCPKLENIAGERLPASLTKLHIIRSPLLKERCCQKHPQVWTKISHVHDIEVDWEPIS